MRKEEFSYRSYLMLAFNALTGPAPSGLNYSKIANCGYGARGEECCFLTSIVSNVYDESKETGVTNSFDCPLPGGAAEHCHASCVDGASGATANVVETAEEESFVRREWAFSEECQQCDSADASVFPQCAVRDSALIWDHIQAAYCTDEFLVVFADSIPNHAVNLEAMPKPPGAGQKQGDYSVRVWNTQSYAYRIPLRPTFATDGSITNYSGAGAMAMAANGVSMYPIMEPDIAAIDLEHEDRDGHDRSKNMKLDGQLDSCNEHAGRGFDVH